MTWQRQFSKIKKSLLHYEIYIILGNTQFMTLRDTVTKWHAAMCLLEENKFTEATQKLLEIQKPSAKILYNLGCICMLQQRYEDAIQYFNTGIDQDKYLAVALCQRGICYHEIKRFDKARSDFIDALSKMHSEGIDYKQLGAEIVLTPQLLNHFITVTEENSKSKMLVKLQTLPVKECIFQPPKAVVNNLVKQDFLENATVISSTKEKDIVMASENRKLLPAGMQGKNQKSFSVPSSPASSRYNIKTSSVNRINIPPPPKRPPPRLPSDVGNSLELRLKSRSLEDMIASDLVYEDTEEKAKLVNKPVIVNFNSLSANCSRLCPSHANINGDLTKEFKLQHHTTNQDTVSKPSLHTVIVQNLDKPCHNVFRSNIPDTQISSRPVLNQTTETSSLNQGDNASTGHAARMRSLFERGDNSDKQSQTKMNIVTTQKYRPIIIQPGSIMSSQQSSRSITQSSSLLTTVPNSSIQKSPKPERPPPPKLSK